MVRAINGPVCEESRPSQGCPKVGKGKRALHNTQQHPPFFYDNPDTVFRLPTKYQLLRPLGKGAYGVVIACKNVQTGSKVAVKKISPMCASTTDGKHTLRELRLCRHLGRHDNIISLKDIVVDIPEDTIYLVMKLYDTDLHKIIQSPQPLGDAHLKHFLYQLLRGLKFAHSYQIIHRDLKPANLVRLLY